MATALERLRAVARAAPALDEAAAARATEAQQIQVNQVVQQAPATAGVRDAQALAPKAVLAVAQPKLQAQEAAAATQAALGQQALQIQGQQAQTAQTEARVAQAETLAGEARTTRAAGSAADRAQRKTLTTAELAQSQRLQTAGITTDARLGFLSNKQREDLSRLGRDVKAQLADSRLQFARDEDGRKFTNDRQLWDYNVASAKSDEQLKDRMQSMQQVYERKSKMLDIAFGKILGELDRQQAWAEQEDDQVSLKRIANHRAAVAREQERQRHDAAQKGMMVQAVSTAVVIGATAYGGPAAGAGAKVATDTAAESQKEGG